MLGQNQTERNRKRTARPPQTPQERERRTGCETLVVSPLWDGMVNLVQGEEDVFYGVCDC